MATGLAIGAAGAFARPGGQEREHNTKGFGRKLVMKLDQNYEGQAVNALMLHFVQNVME
jgi:hypothetical protein